VVAVAASVAAADAAVVAVGALDFDSVHAPATSATDASAVMALKERRRCISSPGGSVGVSRTQ
jgi:hypothetical protein